MKTSPNPVCPDLDTIGGGGDPGLRARVGGGAWVDGEWGGLGEWGGQGLGSVISYFCKLLVVFLMEPLMNFVVLATNRREI